MRAYVVARLGQTVFVIFAVSLVVFVLLRSSGDPSSVLLPFDSTPAQREELRRELGLDQPLPLQYWAFVSRAVQGDFGDSLRYRQPALRLVAERLPNTLQLALASITIALVVGLLLGLLAGVRRGGVLDKVAVNLALLAEAVPGFWLGILLILVFAVTLRWLPTSGAGSPLHLMLPAVTLSAAFIAQILLLVRVAVIDALREPYVQTARSKGLGEQAVVTRHVLRNVLIPVITVVGLNFGTLLGGAIITETVFSWPGVGLLSVSAIYTRDFPIVQAAVFTLSLAIVATNLLVDMLYGIVDPRIRAR